MQRVNWIDNLRGWSILAVIFYHCSFATNWNMGHFTLPSQLLNEILMPVRMGIMFFISGLFVEAGLRKGYSIFIKNKFKSILYPFIIWVSIYSFIKLFFSHVDQDISGVLIPHLTGGGEITWFLIYLFMYFILITGARRLPFWVVFTVCIFTGLFLPPVIDNSPLASFDNTHFNKFFYLFIFFWLGDAVQRANVNLISLCNRRGVVFGSFVTWLALTAVVLIKPGMANESGEVLNWQQLSLLLPLALGTIPLFLFIGIKSKNKVVAYIGQNSIVFYLTHFLVVKVLMRVFKDTTGSLWLDDARYLLVIIGVLSFPWIICQLRERGWFEYLFTLKKPVKAKLEAAS